MPDIDGEQFFEVDEDDEETKYISYSSAVGATYCISVYDMEKQTKMSPQNQVKFKAALEAEKPFGVTLADMEDIASNLDQYEMSTQSDTPGAFFKEYLCKHMDTRFDPEWLDTLMCFREGNAEVRVGNKWYNLNPLFQGENVRPRTKV